jgi:hypothetical protein
VPESVPSALVSTAATSPLAHLPVTLDRWRVDMPGVRRLLRRQAGVISRGQVLALGGDDTTIERLLRRREWSRILTGVYVDHTGPPSWEQRAWAAVLFAEPAALSGAAALHAHGVRGHEEPTCIELATPRGRRVRAVSGIQVTRCNDYDRIVQAHLSPPRLRVEAALLRVASGSKTEDGTVAVLADACQCGATTSGRLAAELDEMPSLSKRRLIAEILTDVAEGAMSPLERRYLRDVERAHALPRGRRQRPDRVAGSLVVRDVEYPSQATEVELDGRLGHDAAHDRWDDLDRDLGSVADGKLTVRLGWRQVLQPCRTAVAVGRILMMRGWSGPVGRCRAGCGAG